jgi:hypothetical protein
MSTHDHDELIVDDDPAPDYIVYQEMTGREKKPHRHQACLGMLVLLFRPMGSFGLALWL